MVVLSRTTSIYWSDLTELLLEEDSLLLSIVSSLASEEDSSLAEVDSVELVVGETLEEDDAEELLEVEPQLTREIMLRMLRDQSMGFRLTGFIRFYHSFLK